ncbi:hypothetical protein FFF34_003730 [Inquilinus sp. KBS0705]|nr:hypothetical protein FFF34_003730 [Inquilinus sp. KBS0705]
MIYKRLFLPQAIVNLYKNRRMLKKLCTLIAFFTLLFTGSLYAQQPIQRDTLIDIIQQKDQLEREKRLIRFIKNYFQNAPATQSAKGADTILQLLVKYNLPDSDAFAAFIDGLSFNKTKDLKSAGLKMLKAVQIAAKLKDSYLLYQFLSHLGFIQTDEGNFIGAVYSYRMAKKEALTLKDNYLQAILDVNISDLYYKSGLYAQSINYLDKALALTTAKDVNNKKVLRTVIYYNKSENYFRMHNYDSLITYHKKLLSPENVSYKITTYRARTDYYLSLLKHNYPKAIKQIIALKQNPRYTFSELEDLHLSDAYYMNGQLDSAQVLVSRLLSVATDNNHPEIKYHLYEILAQIAEKGGDTKLAAMNYELALKESQENNSRITQVGNISSQIKIDETESSYNQKAEIYERERLWLIFTVIVSALIIVTIALIYRNGKQKRHYEKLLFAAKKEELAFINSHEVRRHLTNILGIIDILKHSENKQEDYAQVEAHLLTSAAQLDKAIKNISEKLNEE